MNSRELIAMSKLGKKKTTSYEQGIQKQGSDTYHGIDAQVSEEYQPGLTDKAGAGMGSLGLLKAAKAANLGGLPSNAGEVERLRGEVELGPTEIKKYSPIKTYLKKGK